MSKFSYILLSLFYTATIFIPRNSFASNRTDLANQSTFYFEGPKTGGFRGALSVAFLAKIKSLCNAKIFVESGTYQGATVATALTCFDEVHSIELGKSLYQTAQAKFRNFHNVHLYCGDSVKVLPSILNTIHGTAVFWLDGHYSCGDTAKGSENTPIMKELNIIKTYSNDAIILIDDIRFFQNSEIDKSLSAAADYPTLGQVIKILESMPQKYSFALIGDVFMAYPSKLQLSFSPVIQACTISRLAEHGLFSLEEAFAQEKIIENITGAERSYLNLLCQTFNDLGEETKKFGLDRYFHFWNGLSLITADPIQAFEYLTKAHKRGLSKKHITPYISKCLHNLENKTLNN